MADTLNMLSVVSFLLAGVLGMIAVVLWLRFDVPGIMGDLSGKTAQKSVREIRGENEREAEEETEKLDRDLPDGKTEGGEKEDEIQNTAENIMIIHTDEVI